jgi:hypothetical protein
MIQLRAPDDRPAVWQLVGHFSDRPLVLGSGLWNQRHVAERHDPTFLDLFKKSVERT